MITLPLVGRAIERSWPVHVTRGARSGVVEQLVEFLPKRKVVYRMKIEI